MTSVLARFGQWETRQVVQTLWRPRKRKREEWACWHCRARTVQRRGHSDDSLKVNVGDYLFPPTQDGNDSNSGVPIRRTWAGLERGKAQPTRRGTGEAGAGWGTRPSLNDRDEVRSAEFAEDSGRMAPQESAHNVLWERFEQVDSGVAGNVEAAGLSQEAIGDFALDDAQNYTFGTGRDPTLLHIDYAAELPSALERQQVDLTARCLFAAAQADDLDFIRGLSQDMFTAIVRVMEPASSIDKIASAHMEMSDALSQQLGIASMQRVAFEYAQLVSEIVAMRRSGGCRLTLADYTILLRSARDLGNRNLARALWKRLQADGITPTTECYNYYMAATIFARMHAALGRQKLRILPFNMLARKVPKPGKAFASFHIGTSGLKAHVMAQFREMLDNGATADEESFRLVITAAAREGEMNTVKSVLRKVWNIDVDGLLSGSDEPQIVPKELPEDSPLRPTSKLLFTVAHAFGINNDISAALRLVDFISRHYNFEITQQTWAQLFEWTFVLSVPRTGVKAQTDGTRTGQLPKQSVLNLWETMTSPPYSIKPTMGMYNHLIKNLLYRHMSPTLIQKMKEGFRLQLESAIEAQTRWKALKHEIQRSWTEADAVENLVRMRDEWEHAEMIRTRDVFWCKRWMRLLLASLRAPMSVDTRGHLSRYIPPLLRKWQRFAPSKVQYETTTGMVEFWMRTEEEFRHTRERGEKRRQEIEWWLRFVPKFVGEEWLRQAKQAGTDGASSELDTGSSSPERSGLSNWEDLGDEASDSFRDEVREAVGQALDRR